MEVIRLHAEELYAEEIKILIKEDKEEKPASWQMSPQQVLTYIMGGKTKKGVAIEPKYFGQRRLVELAIATLLTDRALLLIGVPGTAKSWLSEHLAAAIMGDSSLMIQGTSGTSEDAIRYGWNYAKLLQEGPSQEALVASPVIRAMNAGKLVRIEELTRIPSDIQDALITVLSEKSLPVPELNLEIRAKSGFNVIATANDRDKGVHDLSSALQRRFNIVRLPLPVNLEEELKIVNYRVKELQGFTSTPKKVIKEADIKKLITVFRELRSGHSEEGDIKIKSPTATLSTAEVISAVNSSQTMAHYFGHDDANKPIAESIVSAVVKDASKDQMILEEYLETVMKSRKGWTSLYKACKEVLDGKG